MREKQPIATKEGDRHLWMRTYLYMLNALAFNGLLLIAQNQGMPPSMYHPLVDAMIIGSVTATVGGLISYKRADKADERTTPA